MLPGPCNVSWLLICKNLEVTAIYHLRIGKRFRSAFEKVLQNPQLVAWLLGVHREIKPMLLASLKSPSFKKGDGAWVFSASFSGTGCTLLSALVVKSPAKGFPTNIAKRMQRYGQNSCGAWTKWLWWIMAQPKNIVGCHLRPESFPLGNKFRQRVLLRCKGNPEPPATCSPRDLHLRF